MDKINIMEPLFSHKITKSRLDNGNNGLRIETENQIDKDKQKDGDAVQTLLGKTQ